MTELERDAVPAGEQEDGELLLPGTSGGSLEQGSAKVSQDAELVKRLDQLDQQLKRLPDLIDAGIKSTKDKRFQALEGVDPVTLKKFKAYLDKYQGDEDKAIREMRVDEILDGQSSKPADRSGSPASEKRMTRYVRRLLSSAGVSFRDPEYLAIVNKHSSPNGVDEDAFYDDVDDLVEQRRGKKDRQEAEPTGAVVVEGGRVAGHPDAEKKYIAEMQAARGKGAAFGRAIKEKYRKLGVDIDSIVLA